MSSKDEQRIEMKNKNVYATINEIEEENIQSEFLLDNCCSQHFCNDIKLFFDYKREQNVFSMQGDNKLRTQGIGTIKLRCKSLISGATHILTLNNVVHDPKGKNLISVGKLNNSDLHYCTFPRFRYNNVTYKRYLRQSSENQAIFEVIPSARADECVKLQCTPVYPGQKQLGIPLIVSATIADSEDYKFCPKRFKRLDEIHGPFDQELYSDENNQQLSSNPKMLHFTTENKAEENCWKNKNNYGNCPYTDHAITKMLEKAMNDFMEAVQKPGDINNTKFVFILPSWKSTQWYREYKSYFRVLETIQKGTDNVFTVPCEENDGLDHDKGRKYTGPLRWDVEIWYKDMYTASTITDVKLMHLRLGHCDVQDLRKAQNKYGFVRISVNDKSKPSRSLCRQISSTEKIFCSACHIAKFANANLGTSTRKRKQNHDSEQGGVTIPNPENAEFNKKARAINFGDLFYVDTLYVNLPTLLQERYALVFIDYATRYVFVYPIKDRGEDEVVASLKRFIIDAKRTVPDCELITIQSDQGTEYKSAWARTCKENDPKLVNLTAGTEAHNSQATVERVIGTLKMKMRAMMYTAQCDPNMWSHALLHATYLYNRTPHSALKEQNICKCPLEAATKKTPDYGRLRVFGCATYETIPAQQWEAPKAIADRMRPTMYVGNDPDGNYIVYPHRVADEDPSAAQGGKFNLLFDENVTRFGYSIDKIINNPEPAHRDKHIRVRIEDIEFVKNVKLKSIEKLGILDDGELLHGAVKGKIQDEKGETRTAWVLAYSLYSNNDLKEFKKQFALRENENSRAHKYNHNETHVQDNMKVLWEYLKKVTVDVLEKGDSLIFVPKIRRHKVDREWKKTLCTVVAYIPKQKKKRCVIVNLTEVGKPNNLAQIDNQLSDLPEKGEQAVHCVYRDMIFGESIQEYHENLLTSYEGGHRGTVNSAHKTKGDTTLNGHSDSPDVQAINKEFLMYKEPMTYKQAMEDKYSSEWQKATDSELQQFDDKGAMVPITSDEMEGTKPIKSKIVYKLKLFASGNIEKFKARIVAKGYTQIFGINFDETFSPTPAIGGVRLVICFILQYKLKRKSGDVTGAFLESKLKEKVFLEMPDGLTFKGSKYVRLIKSLYGLKQAGRDWNDLQNKIILSFDSNLKQSKQDPCIYFKIEEGCIFVVSVHVDDYVIGYNNDEYCKRFIEHYQSHVKFKVEDELRFILQMEIEWQGNQVFLNQNRQIETLVRKYNLLDNKRVYSTPMEHRLRLDPGDKYDLPNVPYRELVAALLFISRYTRPDIAYAVNVLCRAATWYSVSPWKAAIWVAYSITSSTQQSTS